MSALADMCPRAKTSRWYVISQARIDDFADVTEDHQFIHVDPAAAAKSVFGGTIAHGFLSLSLLSSMAEGILTLPEGAGINLNYGFDKVRFLTPVAAGKRVRGHFSLNSSTLRAPGQALFSYKVEVEIEGKSRLALAADWLILTIAATGEEV